MDLMDEKKAVINNHVCAERGWGDRGWANADGCVAAIGAEARSLGSQIQACEGRTATNVHQVSHQINNVEGRLAGEVHAVSREVSATSQLTQKAVCDVEGRLSKGQCDTIFAVKDGHNGISKDICDANRNITEAVRSESRTLDGKIVDGFKDVLLKQCDSVDKIVDKVVSGDTTILLQGKDDLYRLTELSRSREKSLCENQREILLQFKESEIQALKNKCDLSKELADCCCELKEKIGAEANTTRALINQLAHDECQRENAQLKAELLAAKYAKHVA